MHRRGSCDSIQDAEVQELLPHPPSDPPAAEGDALVEQHVRSFTTGFLGLVRQAAASRYPAARGPGRPRPRSKPEDCLERLPLKRTLSERAQSLGPHLGSIPEAMMSPFALAPAPLDRSAFALPTDPTMLQRAPSLKRVGLDNMLERSSSVGTHHELTPFHAVKPAEIVRAVSMRRSLSINCEIDAILEEARQELINEKYLPATEEYVGDTVKPFSARSDLTVDVSGPCPLPTKLAKRVKVNCPGLVLFLLFCGTFVFYFTVRITKTLPLGSELWYSIIVLAAELLGALSLLPYGLCLCLRVHDDPPPGVVACLKGFPAHTQLNYHIRVVIPCYKEPLEVIAKTVLAALYVPIPQNCTRTGRTHSLTPFTAPHCLMQPLACARATPQILTSPRSVPAGRWQGYQQAVLRTLPASAQRRVHRRPRARQGRDEWQVVQHQHCHALHLPRRVRHPPGGGGVRV